MRANENLHLIPQVSTPVELFGAQPIHSSEILDIDSIYESSTPSVDMASQVLSEAKRLAHLADRMNFMMRELKSLIKV